MSVTIKDVAREAGVSISTVSKAMNNSPSIPQVTVDKIQAVMERLEYTPNQRAAAFARASTRNISFLTKFNKGRVYAAPHIFEMICGAQNELAKNGYTLTLVDTSNEEKEGETAKKIIMQKSSDGIIIESESITRSSADYIIEKEFPHIIAGKPSFEHSISWIDTNNVLSGKVAAQHLYQCGYKKISFIGGKKRAVISSYRLQGVQSFLLEHDTELMDNHIRSIEIEVNESYKAMLALLKCKTPPDSVICENSLIAVGVFKALEASGTSIPKNMGVIIIDDYPYSRIISPPPTVVNINIYDMGVEIVKALMRKIKNPALQIQAYTTLPELIKRETTAKQ